MLESPVQRILVVRLGHIGDVLVATPVVRALKAQWPQAKLTMVVNEGTHEVVLFNPHIDQLLVVPREGGRMRRAVRQARMLAAVAGGRFDLALELSGGDRGAVLVWLSRAGVRVGFEPKRHHARARAFNLLVDGRGTSDHMVEVLLRQVRAIGIEPGKVGMVFDPGREAMAWAERELARAGLSPRTYALVHPTSRWMFKSWSVRGNAEVINRLLAQGMPVVVTCGPAEREVEFVREVLEGVRGPVLAYPGTLSLLSLGALIAQARVLVGVDSAPVHMASALGTPVVVLFGPSGERMWGPWGVVHEVVAKDWDCRPCGRDGCEGSKISKCLVEITPDEVVEAIGRVLEASSKCA